MALRDDGLPPSFLLSLIDGLPLGSMYLSERMAEGGDAQPHEFLARSAEWYVLADVYDAVMLNTRATGQWKKGKVPEFDPYPRPKSQKKTKKKTSLSGLWQMFGGAGKKG